MKWGEETKNRVLENCSKKHERSHGGFTPAVVAPPACDNPPDRYSITIASVPGRYGETGTILPVILSVLFIPYLKKFSGAKKRVRLKKRVMYSTGICDCYRDSIAGKTLLKKTGLPDYIYQTIPLFAG